MAGERPGRIAVRSPSLAWSHGPRPLPGRTGNHRDAGGLL